MTYQTTCHDNRDNQEMYGYLESRIDALKNRISELEMENAALKSQLESAEGNSPRVTRMKRSAAVNRSVA